MEKTSITKKKIALVFGGRSAEHEVSVVSARNVCAAMDKNKYEVILIGISREGEWVQIAIEKLLEKDNPLIKVEGGSGRSVIPFSKGGRFFLKTDQKEEKIDVAFPILHGPFGEDGAIQGLLKLYNVPFVGVGILGSAVGMDKDVAKRLFREAGIPTAKFTAIKKNKQKEMSFTALEKKLGLPLFVKPANLGSSVGVSKVKNEKEFQMAIQSAFEYDTKIIVEEFVSGKEIECSVLGNETPIASVPGEIVPTHDFYSYEAKYLDENGAKMAIPANIPETVAEAVRHLAVKVFETLGCEGMGRVDFFLTKDNEIFVNEINTIPGFTAISMYPKLWEASGLTYGELIDRLIELAVTRHQEEEKLRNDQ